jgi:tRNA pseudouridine38-40 synthase
MTSDKRLMTNIMAVVQYDGSDYEGFQIQRQRPTIQGALEDALAQVTQERTRIVGAGRTDTGVHARAQVVSFKTQWARSLDELRRAWNARLPAAIAVQSLDAAPADFHARRSAKSRTYRYTINNRMVRAPLVDRYAWHVNMPLDAALMHAALQGLVGKHDFVAFGRPPKREKSTEREVFAARCWREIDWVLVELTANAFLQGMVRRIVGALVALGAGQLASREFANLLHARDKQLVKWKAAPQGLCLWRVEY